MEISSANRCVLHRFVLVFGDAQLDAVQLCFALPHRFAFQFVLKL